MKRCSSCKKTLDLSNFCIRSGTSRLRSNCRKCNAISTKKCIEKKSEHYKKIAQEYRLKNRDKINLRTREWSRKYPEKNENTRLVNTYGITLVERNLMFEKQGGLCAICGKTGSLVVDHDHTTGKVRELLHQRCNLVLGLIEKNSEIMINTHKYILKHNPIRNENE